MERLTHPRGLYILFFTEMWERFSYYGMRALLVLYLVKSQGLGDMAAGQIYGAYTGLVYLTPVLGGYLADKVLGFARAVMLGGVLIALGHLSLAMEGMNWFYTGLGFLVVGTGLFKPNISSLLGGLYHNHPEKKDGGFTIFYMGINLGGMLGPLLCGWLGETMGWHYGFGAAAAGMMLGLLVFTLGKNRLQENRMDIEAYAPPDKKVEKDRMKVIILLALFTVFFWMGFEQAGSSLNLFTDRYTDRFVGGWEVPASMLQSINPFFILLLAPLYSVMWERLQKFNLMPGAGTKFSLGLLFLAGGFFVLFFGSAGVESGSRAGVWIVILAYLLHTMGELFLSPVGLSMVSRLAPARFMALFFGIWFLSNAVAHYLAGTLSGLMSEFESISEFFLFFAGISLAAGMVLFLLRPIITRLAHGVE